MFKKTFKVECKKYIYRRPNMRIEVMEKDVNNSAQYPCKPAHDGTLSCGGGYKPLINNDSAHNKNKNYLSPLSNENSQECNTTRHSETSDMPCEKDMCAQNLTNQKNNHKSAKILNQVQDDTESKNNISTLSGWRGQGVGQPWQKVLQTAAFTLALSFFIAAPALADAPVPTLDTLKGQPIPDTEPQKYYPESGYTYKEIQNADPENLPTNSVTIYEKQEVTKYYDPATGKEVSESDLKPDVEYKEVKTYTTTPKYYTVELKQTDYGHTDKYDSTLDFTITTPNSDKTGKAFEYAVKYYVDSDRLSGRISTNQNGANIDKDFVGVSATSSGGAIYNNKATIGDITGDFIGNYAFSSNYEAKGGAIYNDEGTIGNITGDFIGNYVSSNYEAKGGAIYNDEGTIGNITGNFIGNYVSSYYSLYTGTIYNYDGTIGNITGDFIGNFGTVIYNNSYRLGIIGNITGDFVGNWGTAIYNANGTIGDITGDFIGNSASAIDNVNGTIGDVTGDFIGNYTSGSYAYGGAINNGDKIGDITGDFIGNHAVSSTSPILGGAIMNYDVIGDITGDFIGNYVSATYNAAVGGAIYNLETIGQLDDNRNLVGGIYGSFINNYATTDSDSELALGGAVYTDSDMNFIADNTTNYFSGNYTEDSRGKINNAIFVQTSSSKSPTIKLQAQNNGSIVFDDQIDGGSDSGTTIDRTNAYNLSLTGDTTGTIYLNNDIINANISIDNTNVYVKEASNLAQSKSLAVNSGILNIIHLDNSTINFNNFSNSAQINLASVDVDLANESMGRISADNYGDTTGSINVQHLNLLSDAIKDKTSIEFADKEIANNVQYTGSSSVAYSPIYKYDVTYNTNDEGTGMFTFIRGAGSSSGSYENFNPSVVAPSVATQAGAYTTQIQTFNYAFQHADTFMNIPYMDRLAIINQNKYALSPTSDATDVGTFSPLMTKQETPGFWIKPYASFENIPLKNGPKVSNINYGTLVGYDSPITSVGRGWERVLTGYIGYNGASQRYSGVDTYQNGGILGGTTTFYKGNFFNATTLSVGASSGSSTNMYGSENYAMLLAGIGNKTGYNFEFINGKVILQPSFLISYTFVNTFDYTNSAGLRIESDPMHAIQLAPGIKLIGNLKNGWQPYIGVNMIWNLLQDSKVTANDVRLPEMSIKPYVQYGVGLQKLINDRFMAYGQAMIHNGGRNGISFSAGFRWKIGKE